MQIIAATIIKTLACVAVASGVVVVLPAAAQSAASEAGSRGPRDVIAELSSQLFAALDQEPAPGRHDTARVLALIDRLLAPRFDAEYTARLVLGRHWSSATPAQRQQFATAFYQRLLRTYVVSVAGWTADRVKLLPLNSDAAALQVTVHTRVTSPGEADARVDYRLRQTSDGWKIFDVVVDGVSYAHSYYGDIDADVSRNGIDAAIARLALNNTAAARPAPRPRVQ